MMVLNNPKMSGIVLLSLNALASAHYHNLLKKFYKRAIEISETMSQTDKDLAEMVIKQFPNVKNGVVPNSQTGGKRHRSHIIPASFHKRKY